MKRLLFILIAFCINASLLKAESPSNFKQITLQVYEDDDREIRDKDPSHPVQPVVRGLVSQPVYAYLCNNVISIDFTETFSTAIISITHKSTNEIIYSEMSSVPNNLSIDLNGENNGEYLIKIEADDILLEGVFSL